MSKIVGLLFIQRSQQLFSTPTQKKKKKKREERFGWRNSQKPVDGKVKSCIS